MNRAYALLALPFLFACTRPPAAPAAPSPVPSPAQSALPDGTVIFDGSFQGNVVSGQLDIGGMQEGAIELTDGNPTGRWSWVAPGGKAMSVPPGQLLPGLADPQKRQSELEIAERVLAAMITACPGDGDAGVRFRKGSGVASKGAGTKTCVFGLGESGISRTTTLDGSHWLLSGWLESSGGAAPLLRSFHDGGTGVYFADLLWPDGAGFRPVLRLDPASEGISAGAFPAPCTGEEVTLADAKTVVDRNCEGKSPVEVVYHFDGKNFVR